MIKSLFCTVFLTAFFLFSCDFDGETINGNGNFRSENRHIDNITKVNVTGGIDVFVEQGTPSVKAEGDENILRYIETRSDGDWLEIKTRDNVNIHSSQPVKVFVTVPEIIELKVAGSGNITCNNKFSTGENMSFNITGSGSITAFVNAPAVNASITGSGNMYIKGETRNADINITGSGNYESPNLKAENAAVKISGSGDANLFADNNLKASILGSGGIKYSGNAVVAENIAGSGRVTKVP